MKKTIFSLVTVAALLGFASKVEGAKNDDLHELTEMQKAAVEALAQSNPSGKIHAYYFDGKFIADGRSYDGEMRTFKGVEVVIDDTFKEVRIAASDDSTGSSLELSMGMSLEIPRSFITSISQAAGQLNNSQALDVLQLADQVSEVYLNINSKLHKTNVVNTNAVSDPSNKRLSVINQEPLPPEAENATPGEGIAIGISGHDNDGQSKYLCKARINPEGLTSISVVAAEHPFDRAMSASEKTAVVALAMSTRAPILESVRYPGSLPFGLPENSNGFTVLTAKYDSYIYFGGSAISLYGDGSGTFSAFTECGNGEAVATMYVRNFAKPLDTPAMGMTMTGNCLNGEVNETALREQANELYKTYYELQKAEGPLTKPVTRTASTDNRGRICSLDAYRCQ